MKWTWRAAGRGAGDAGCRAGCICQSYQPGSLLKGGEGLPGSAICLGWGRYGVAGGMAGTLSRWIWPKALQPLKGLVGVGCGTGCRCVNHPGIWPSPGAHVCLLALCHASELCSGVLACWGSTGLEELRSDVLWSDRSRVAEANKAWVVQRKEGGCSGYGTLLFYISCCCCSLRHHRETPGTEAM